MVTTRRIEDNEEAANVNQQRKVRFTSPPQQFRRTNINLSELQQQTDEASLAADQTATIPTKSVLIQQTKDQLQDDQLSDPLPQTTFKNSIFQASQLRMCATQHAQTKEVSHEVMTPNNIATTSRSFNLTKFAEENHNDDDFSDIDSIRGDSTLTTIRGYRVKPEYSTILTSILSKNGDIGAKSPLRLLSVCSIYMETLCDIVQKLKDTNIKIITVGELDDMRASVYHIGNAGSVEVAWLINRLDEIYEAKLAMPKLLSTSNLKLQYDELKQRIYKSKEQLEEYKKCYLTKCEEALALRNKISAAQSDIAMAENQARETGKIISESREKLSKVYQLGSLVNGLVEIEGSGGN